MTPRPQIADSICMRAEIDIPPSRTLASILEYCIACEHSLFVHRDNEEQNCLYSTCSCPGFTRATA